MFRTSLSIGLLPETPTPNPAPRGGELFRRGFSGHSPRKTAPLGFPLPSGKGQGDGSSEVVTTNGGAA